MINFIRGQRVKINDVLSTTNLTLSSCINMNTTTELDMTCFGVDEEDKITDDRYFIFYNQITSPEGSIQKIQETNNEIGRFTINLAKLPSKIKKIVITVAIDGNTTMNNMQTGSLKLFNGTQQVAEFNFSGQDYSLEKALILAELYQKDNIWRINFIAKGFNGGLSQLLKFYGGTENKTPVPTPLQTTTNIKSTISLTKTEQVHKLVLEKAPHLIDLTKKATLTLEKKKLTDIIARVALVIDRSGSMNWQYKNGDVQKVFDKVLPLALMFDDDKQLDVWTFADRFRRLSSISVNNIKDYVETEADGWRYWNVGGRNNEVDVMQDVINEYKTSKVPAYVIFISDGGITANTKIKKLIIESSNYPIFWQFVGIGGRNYGILEKLDTLENRLVDNVSFFTLDNINQLTDDEIYQKLLFEFPTWLKEIKTKGILYQ